MSNPSTDGPEDDQEHYDIIVVGGGNAALCAALSARDHGASVLVLERAPLEERGGNTAFAGGGMRVPYRGREDMEGLMPQLTEDEWANIDVGSYTESDFFKDIARLTQYRADPDMAELLVTRSFETLKWMTTHGVKFLPSYGRQAFKIDGQHKFWGGVPLETAGGGQGLVEALTNAATDAGISILYNARATDLLADDDGVHGVRARVSGQTRDLHTGSVILACGGFEANLEWRTRYLGPGWDLAKVRGTRFNTGDGIRMALDIGAQPYGHWSGCHAVGWERNAPDFGNLRVGHGFNKHHYHLGVMVNADGQRFVDEGADIRNFTYAKYGREILKQPGQFAWQVFDAKASPLLQRDYYRIREVTRVTADTLEELTQKLEGVDAEAALRTIEDFNAAADSDREFDPTVKDGRSTTGLDLPKSNWANPIDEPPFEAFAVTCGITFTFGGVKTSTSAEVLSTDETPIKGLYACGELVGGLFYFNYPGGSGLSWGSVMGRIAGEHAAASSAAKTSGVLQASE